MASRSGSKKPTVAVDLDGVLAQYDGWKGIDHIGDPIEGAQEFIAGLRERYRVVIFTTRTSGINCRVGVGVWNLVERVQDWLDRHGFVVDGIHEGDGKPLAAAIIDDRAVPCRPQTDARGTDFAYAEALTMTMYLVDSVHWGEEQDAYAQQERGGPATVACPHDRRAYAPQASTGYRCIDCGEEVSPA